MSHEPTPRSPSPQPTFTLAGKAGSGWRATTSAASVRPCACSSGTSSAASGPACAMTAGTASPMGTSGYGDLRCRLATDVVREWEWEWE